MANVPIDDNIMVEGRTYFGDLPSPSGGGVNLDDLPASTSDPTDNELVATREANGWVKKTFEKVWNYIKTKLGISSQGSTGKYLNEQGRFTTPPGTFEQINGLLFTSGKFDFYMLNRKIQANKSTSAWDAQVCSAQGYVFDCAVSFKPVQTNMAIMVGLDTNPTQDASYENIDFCWYLKDNGKLNIYRSGTAQITDINYAAGDDLRIEHTKFAVRFIRNRIVVLEIAMNPIDSPKYYVDASFYGTSGAIYDFCFGTIPYSVEYARSASSASSAGTAGSATSAAKVDGTYSGSGGQQAPNYFGTNKVGFLMSNVSINSDSHYKNIMYMDCYSGNDVGGVTALALDRMEAKGFLLQSDKNRTSWNNSAELLTTANYSSYAAKNTEAIKNITRSGTTFTATRTDGTTFTFTQQDNNTTYSANNGVGLSGTTFYNSGVRDVSINGNYLRKNVNGTNTDLTIPYATKASQDSGGYALSVSSTNVNTTIGGSFTFKKYGRVVVVTSYCIGAVSAAGTLYQIATIPSGYRPTQAEYLNVANAASNGMTYGSTRFTFAANGAISMTTEHAGYLERYGTFAYTI